jgi:hypothetical protein
MILNGGFSPLDMFMDRETYQSVVEKLRLGPRYNDAVFPMPITLDVSETVRCVCVSGVFGAPVHRRVCSCAVRCDHQRWYEARHARPVLQRDWRADGHGQVHA